MIDDSISIDRSLPGHLGEVQCEKFVSYMIHKHDLLSCEDQAVDQELWELVENLDGLSIRDQQVQSEIGRVEKDRKSAKRAALEIQRLSSGILNSLEHLRINVQAFEAAIGAEYWAPPVLAQALEIDYPSPTLIDPPDSVDGLRGIFHLHPTLWVEVKSVLDSALAVKVRARMPAGVRNYVLQQGLLRCRSFWQRFSAPGKPWRRDTIVHAPYLDDKSKVSQVAGAAEAFVVDMFVAANIVFDLSTLNGAWAAIEGDIAEKEQTSGISNRKRRIRT